MSQEDVETVRRATDAFNRGDVDALGALLTPDAEIVPLRAAMEETTYQGPQAAAAFLSDSHESWESLHLEESEIRDLGECVLAFGVLRARGRSSGVDVEVRLAWAVRFRDGLITSIRTYTDPAEAIEAAGVSD
jgi:ketosteroid isomerase-like protein